MKKNTRNIYTIDLENINSNDVSDMMKSFQQALMRASRIPHGRFTGGFYRSRRIRKILRMTNGT